jgi:hypothetical protein
MPRFTQDYESFGGGGPVDPYDPAQFFPEEFRGTFLEGLRENAPKNPTDKDRAGLFGGIYRKLRRKALEEKQKQLRGQGGPLPYGGPFDGLNPIGGGGRRSPLPQGPPPVGVRTGDGPGNLELPMHPLDRHPQGFPPQPSGQPGPGRLPPSSLPDGWSLPQGPEGGKMPGLDFNPQTNANIQPQGGRPQRQSFPPEGGMDSDVNGSMTRRPRRPSMANRYKFNGGW